MSPLPYSNPHQPKRTSMMLEMSDMLERELALRTQLDWMLDNHYLLPAQQPALNLALQDSVRRINNLRTQLKRMVLTFTPVTHYQPEATLQSSLPSPNTNHASSEYIQRVLGMNTTTEDTQTEYLRETLDLPPKIENTPLPINGDRAVELQEEYFKAYPHLRPKSEDTPPELMGESHLHYGVEYEGIPTKVSHVDFPTPDPDIQVQVRIHRYSANRLAYTCSICRFQTTDLERIADHVTAGEHKS